MSRPASRFSLVETARAHHQTRRFGDFEIVVFQNVRTTVEHIVLSRGPLAGPVLCRVQSQCRTGCELDAIDCDCRDQLEMSLRMIDDEGSGLLVLLTQEGRGHGITTKIRALANKNRGMDTFEAVERLGLRADVREYWEAADILEQLGATQVRLITNSPEKKEALTRDGIEIVAVVPVQIEPTAGTRVHLLAKRHRGHWL